MELNDAVKGKIEDYIKGNRVVLFMKGTRQSPMCGFSAKTVAALDSVVPEYVAVNVLDDPDIREDQGHAAKRKGHGKPGQQHDDDRQEQQQGNPIHGYPLLSLAKDRSSSETPCSGTKTGMTSTTDFSIGIIGYGRPPGSREVS